MRGLGQVEGLFGAGPCAAFCHTAVLTNREIPESGPVVSSEMESLNLIFVVAGAVFIAFLARFLARRGGRKK